MTVQSVCREVAAFVGVRPPPGSLFVPPEQDRTAWELVQLANEMVQRIAYDTREWTKLRSRAKFDGALIPDPANPTGPLILQTAFNLPADFQRMLKTAQVWRSNWTTGPMEFISDPDDWLRREVQNTPSTCGSWMIEDGKMNFRPGLDVGETATFYYLRNTCVKLVGGGFGDRFMVDDDSFVLPERLLKLGMVWQWKAYKGGSYAEDIANYEDALANIQGADKPAPIIVGSMPISSDANIAYWGPTPPPGTFVGPGP